MHNKCTRTSRNPERGRGARPGILRAAAPEARDATSRLAWSPRRTAQRARRRACRSAAKCPPGGAFRERPRRRRAPL
ncbi:hypothetical protein [Lysobacter gummosus]|uniref:hypothetical protein n=1 Tax=Lysobacter gummosus TaxID=262324 RepID=UPI003628F552